MDTKAKKIYDVLYDIHGEAKCELNFSSDFELLVAVILSAQCTDKRVNQVTDKLFKLYNTPQQFAMLKQAELEKLIYSCGFYHNKAKAIINASKQIISQFNGKVPSSLTDLQKLSGVGRKTANVVYATAFNGDAIAVDTHVYRVSHRLGLTDSKNELNCEKDLMKVFPKHLWSKMHYLMVLFGRYNCKSIKPQCEDCKLKDICNHFKNLNKN